jgi:hypothetical protein
MANLTETLETVGIDAFGLAMPVLAASWTDGTLPTTNDNAMSLSLASGSWRAPLAGTLTRCETTVPNATLVKADGSILTGPGLLLSLYPQEYLRLKRLYSSILEVGIGAGSSAGMSVRPVPRFFFFSGTLSSSNVSGGITVQADIGLSGDMTIYDSEGMPVDPLAVATTFTLFMNSHNPLQHRNPVSASFEPNSQVKQIADLAGGSTITRLRLASFSGQPYNGTHLVGITAVDAASGQFSLNAPTGGAGQSTVTKEAGTGTDGSFSDEERRLLVIGPATTGRLGDGFTPPTLPTGVSLSRDFFSLHVVQLKQFLLGTPAAGFAPVSFEKQARVRIHEPLDLLTDGNDLLAAAASALSGSPTEALCVAQAIDGSFNVPTDKGQNAHWPAFPPLNGVTPAPTGALAVELRNNLNPAAHYFDDGNASTPNIDVILTLNGLPAGAAIRVYPRKFVEDAREARGDGAGGMVPDAGTLTLFLKNPFNFPAVLTTPPSEPTLRFDLMVVKRTGEARLYGNIETTVEAASTAGAGTAGSNPFGSAARRGVSNAGVLGLGTHNLPSVTGLGNLEATLRTVQALTGETNPRDAPRLPGMARRDLLVAGLAGGSWRAALSGGRLAPETYSADPRLGSPGSPGGRETQVVGVSTQNARLAYDIARMAFRRTTNLIDRMVSLAGSSWDEPTQPAELPTGSAPNASQGTMAGAVLQTIAPFCETPELGLLKTLIDGNLASIPADFNALVDWIRGQINILANSSPISGNAFLSGLVGQLQGPLTTALNNLKNNSTLNENQRDRLYNELHRELLTACYGRRDAQWALHSAIATARKFIYIESPGLASTRKDYGTNPVPPYAVDLIDATRARLSAAPGLRVIICVPKFPDFAAGYEAFSAQEGSDRRAKILGLPAERVVSFHPIGFPGRRSRLEATVVIVDDVWGLVGSSTFRRRGLTFDGSSDLVFTDVNLVDSRSASLAAFRRKLMAARLGVSATTSSAFGPMPDPTFVRLSDGAEAFYAIRDFLVAGGLGRIERLWNNILPGVNPVPPVSLDLANPDGQEFDLFGTLALILAGGLNGS